MLETTQLYDIGPLGPSIRPEFLKDIVLERQLGSGATSIVYLGYDREDPARQYAVKVLTQYLVTKEDVRKRWDREAKLIIGLDHPNIVKGVRHGVQEGRPYLVMEYLQGETLSDRLRRLGKLSEEEILHIAESALNALQAAYAENILHRDVKPANLIWLKDGTVKLTDFGLAKFADDSSVTITGAIVGTPMYISPEQARCEENITTRSDLYSLGVMLFHLACGKPPFSELNTSLLLTRKITDDVPDVRSVDDSISGTLAYLIDRLCRRFSQDRPENPAAALHLLQQLRSGALSTTHFEPAIRDSRAKKHPARLDQIPAEMENPILATISSDSQISTQPFVVTPGEVLFYEDEEAHECYILLSGAVEVLKSGRQIATIEEPGSFIGEMGPLRRVPRSATVVATEETLLLVIDEKDFYQFFSRHPDMGIALAQSLASRLEHTSDQLHESQMRLANVTRLLRDMEAAVGLKK